jgi:hypothetical protein
VTLICSPCTERGKACLDTPARVGGERERPKQHDLQGLEYRRGARRRTGS